MNGFLPTYNKNEFTCIKIRKVHHDSYGELDEPTSQKTNPEIETYSRQKSNKYMVTL